GVEDPDYLANLLWTETLGMMHLARIRVGVRQAAPGIPELFTIAPERVVESVVAHAQAIVGSA
ncbi:MAG: TetR/AcrR family transcriptional regulator, partial [Solirubrobacteraceae bacterium]